MRNAAGPPLTWLAGADAVRARSAQILAACEAGRLAHFALDPDRLDHVAALVAEETRRRYPDLRIPPHSRWRHFVVDGHDRWQALAAQAGQDGALRLQARLDLVVTSVLLDAGAGPGWRWRDPATGRTFARSEGLALASLEAFRTGLFSSDPSAPLRADARALAAITPAALAHAFQAGADNPLQGLDGRALLLRRLGRTLEARPDLFGKPGRIGHLAPRLKEEAGSDGLDAGRLLAILLDAFGPIWPGGLVVDGVHLGDVGRHPAARAEGPTDGLIPFHKLSQWLAYSLLEPLAEAGIPVVGQGRLTALAEYRNGGLLVDAGLLVPRHPGVREGRHPVDSELVVEWRALTVALIDRLAPLVRAALGPAAAGIGLAEILEGGTWHAGRRLARALRPDGAPPIDISSDGTVF